MQADMQGNIVHEGPMEFGGETVTSFVEAGYVGHCAVKQDSSDQANIAVLSCYGKALCLARYATTPDGGYGSVVVVPTDEPVTHFDLLNWILGVGVCHEA